MAHQVTATSPCGLFTAYSLTSNSHDDVRTHMEQIRQNALPGRVVWHGPYLQGGRFVAHGSLREYVEGV